MKRTGAVATVVALASAVAGGVAVNTQRRAIGRARRAPDPFAEEPLGSLHSAPLTVTCNDGTHLAVEVDGDPEAPLTIIFAHGFTLSMDSWHFQRRDLGDLGRLVFYDQRCHGSSGRGRSAHSTIDQLGADLESVIEDIVPTGPIVLIGHSMGGMTILSLADRRPDLFGERVVGVGLMSTSAGSLAAGLFGLPGWTSRGLETVLPRLSRGVHKRSAAIEKGRRVGTDLSYAATRWVSYGPDVPPSLVDFMEAMISATPFDVMTEFFDTFLSHDKLSALKVLSPLPALVFCGDLDVLTPVSHSQAMAEALPAAELLIVPGAGHMAIIDRYAVANAAIRRLVATATARA